MRGLFRHSNISLEYTDFAKLYKGINVPHLHFPLYYEIDQRIYNATRWTVVRNPIDRFVSSMRHYVYHNIIPHFVFDMIIKKDEMFSFIDNIRQHRYESNWLRPQVEFVDDSTHIWKFEDGYDLKFRTWIEGLLRISLDASFTYETYIQNIKNANEGVGTAISEFGVGDYIKLNSNHISWIKEYYAEDFKKFNYEY